MTMRKRPNHLLHAILSLITGGLWLVPWAVIAYRDGKRQRELELELARQRMQQRGIA